MVPPIATAPRYAGLSRCPVTPVSTIPRSGTEILDRIMGAAMRHMSRLLGERLSVKRGSSESVDACQFLADNQLVDCLGSFVGNHALEIQHVTNRHVLGTDARSSEHVASIACNVDCGPAVIPLGE